jgi:hypothetical protein
MLAGVALLILLLLVLISAFRGGRLTIQLNAQTEETRVYLDREGPATTHLNLSQALLITRDSTLRLSDADVVLEAGVMLDFKRMNLDTVRIHLESERGRIGTVFDRDGKELWSLDTLADVRVLPDQGTFGGTFSFPFVARRIEVGEVTSSPSGGRQPRLLSGNVTTTERTLLGDTPERSQALGPGDQFNVPREGGRETSTGEGSIDVDGEKGMTVRFTVQNSSGQITGEPKEEVLASTVVYRVIHDRVIVGWWTLVMLLIIHPIAAALAGRVKEYAERHIDP